MADFPEDMKQLRVELDQAEQYLRISEIRARLPQLETEMSRPDLWDNADRAKATQTEFTAVSDDLKMFDRLTEQVGDVELMWELAAEEGDDDLLSEAKASVAALGKEFSQLELRAMFDGEYDEGDAVCQVVAGAGGTDSQDWAEMLFNMYRRWAEDKKFEFEVTGVQAGSEAGIKTVEFVVRGRYAYGWLQAERGVHRLVRISPFDSQARRHTAFSAFSIVPYIEDATDQLEIDEKDLRVDVYRSSGAGGQHVNTTDSAVRITHLPTNTVVSCQNERSQHQNKDRCMQMLAMKLIDLERVKREETLAAAAGESKKVEWGSQIRSYVLQPYQQVKDERSGEVHSDPAKVLNGDVGGFMEAWLQWRKSGQAPDESTL